MRGITEGEGRCQKLALGLREVPVLAFGKSHVEGSIPGIARSTRCTVCIMPSWSLSVCA